MDGFYFLMLTYKSGRISIRDRPYSTLSAAESARKRRLKKPDIKEISIHYQYGLADPSALIVVP